MWLGLHRQLALCPLALKGHTLLMWFTKSVTLTRRRLVWLKGLQVGEVGEQQQCCLYCEALGA
jgi:hypothetical protein